MSEGFDLPVTQKFTLMPFAYIKRMKRPISGETFDVGGLGRRLVGENRCFRYLHRINDIFLSGPRSMDINRPTHEIVSF